MSPSPNLASGWLVFLGGFLESFSGWTSVRSSLTCKGGRRRRPRDKISKKHNRYWNGYERLIVAINRQLHQHLFLPAQIPCLLPRMHHDTQAVQKLSQQWEHLVGPKLVWRVVECTHALLAKILSRRQQRDMTILNRSPAFQPPRPSQQNQCISTCKHLCSSILLLILRRINSCRHILHRHTLIILNLEPLRLRQPLHMDRCNWYILFPLPFYTNTYE